MELSAKNLKLIYKAVKFYIIEMKVKALQLQQLNFGDKETSDAVAEKLAEVMMETAEYENLLKDLEYCREYGNKTLADGLGMWVGVYKIGFGRCPNVDGKELRDVPSVKRMLVLLPALGDIYYQSHAQHHSQINRVNLPLFHL